MTPELRNLRETSKQQANLIETLSCSKVRVSHLSNCTSRLSAMCTFLFVRRTYVGFTYTNATFITPPKYVHAHSSLSGLPGILDCPARRFTESRKEGDQLSNNGMKHTRSLKLTCTRSPVRGYQHTTTKHKHRNQDKRQHAHRSRSSRLPSCRHCWTGRGCT